MITVMNKQLEEIGILENATRIGYERRFNEIWSASFTLPLDDPKNSLCQPFNIVELYDDEEYIGKFRIFPSLTRKNEFTKEISYRCKHVLSTLMDDVLFQDHYSIDKSTVEALQYLLNQQSTKHWALKTVSPTLIRYFSYKWENENGIVGPIFEVPKTLDTEYQWTHNDQVYPYELSLVEPEKEVTCVLQYGLNQREIDRDVDPEGIVNRIYPLGSGEGINQLTIKDVNNGIPYLEDAESIAKYGLKSYIWPDKRFEDAETLMASAQGLLDKWKIPKVTIRGTAADISKITKGDVHKLKAGRLVLLDDPELGELEARVMLDAKPDVNGMPWDMRIEIANKSMGLADIEAEVERRQQVNELYAQGATNLASYSYNDNCDPDDPAVIKFFIPDEMVKINKALLTFETDYFRAYSKAAKSTATTAKTTKSGGGSTTSAGGGQTTSAGGGQTSSASGEHKHRMFSAVGFQAAADPNLSVVLRADNGHYIYVDSDTAAGLEYYTEGSSGTHAHNVDDHVHQVDDHVHQVPAHEHEFEIPGHGHALEYGIYKHTSLPTSITIKVDGTSVPGTSLEAENLDLVPYLSKDNAGNITRGWHQIALHPNNLARINANVITQFFIKSVGNYTL